MLPVPSREMSPELGRGTGGFLLLWQGSLAPGTAAAELNLALVGGQSIFPLVFGAGVKSNLEFPLP